MSREHLLQLVDLIKDHEMFNRGGRRKQTPVEYQLMAYLCHIGHKASSNSTGRDVFRRGCGTCKTYRDRVRKAILSLKDKTIVWPDEAERKENALASRITESHGDGRVSYPAQGLS